MRPINTFGVSGNCNTGLENPADPNTDIETDEVIEELVKADEVSEVSEFEEVEVLDDDVAASAAAAAPAARRVDIWTSEDACPAEVDETERTRQPRNSRKPKNST